MTASTAASRMPATRQTEKRLTGYIARLAVTDAVVVTGAVFGAHLLRFGFSNEPLVIGDSILDVNVEVGYLVTSLLFVSGWLFALQLFGTRDSKVVGSGSLEYRRISDATVRVFGVLAILSLVFQIEFARWYLLIALPSGLILLILSRWMWRTWLRTRRTQGRFLQHALVVGDRPKATHIASQIRSDPEAGIRIIGAVTTHGTHEDLVDGVPVLGDFDHVLDVLEDVDVDAVILSTADAITPERVRRFGWMLDQKRIDLIVAPSLTDVAGPRIHTRPVAGLPLIHVEYPRFEGRQRLAKRSFDIIGSLALIVLFAPVMAAVAVAVKATSKGPVFYSQERVGLRGKPFRMFKFRSMIVGADDHLQSLLDQQGTSDQPLFKVTDDPRITPVGRFIRRYSLDELPQFFNALLGTMSLVGPRPQRAAEVELYDDDAHRRLHMKPGITGLWQVGGRSDLSWNDAIRLDLYYVENWSVASDVIVVARTAAAVVKPSGAH
ncbi:sugar transferase [Microbacterium esteraromaticum]|uniref:exopolysaccharide biosynthesis polyprenyl glycosylphosphotransferase n=1 Tax=Microbacterium esteraromaticum TaxID=57043 RepID=UPI001A8FD197|nr:sugar transferase [Microbacterium esteraromaticum]